MREADYEAKRERRDRERQAGEAFQKILRERLEAGGPRVEALMDRGGENGHAGKRGGSDDAA
jgi:hypothetical protein